MLFIEGSAWPSLDETDKIFVCLAERLNGKYVNSVVETYCAEHEGSIQCI